MLFDYEKAVGCRMKHMTNFLESLNRVKKDCFRGKEISDNL